jgi:hypothetical protein
MHGQTTYRTYGWPVESPAPRPASRTDRWWRRRAHDPQRVGRGAADSDREGTS